MWKPQDEAEFISRYQSGATYKDLAVQFNTTRDKVKYYLSRLRSEGRIARRKAVARNNELAGNDKLEQRLFQRLRKASAALTIEELANSFDVSPKRIREAVAKLQLEKYLVDMTTDDFVFSSAPESGCFSSHFIKHSKGTRVKIGVVADTHFCSNYAKPELLDAVYDIFASEGVTHVYHCGNWIDGERRINRMDIHVHGLDNQCRYFVNNYHYRSGITTYYIAGDDHEGWYTQDVGVDIGQRAEDLAKRAGRDDLVYLGYMEHDVYVKSGELITAGNGIEGATRIRVQHPGGGTAYATSYSPQKLVESLSGGDKPHILLLGHYHKLEYGIIRNVHTVQVGCLQLQTRYMRKKKIPAHLGAVLVEFVQGDDGTVLEFVPRIIPFMNTKHDQQWSCKL